MRIDGQSALLHDDVAPHPGDDGHTGADYEAQVLQMALDLRSAADMADQVALPLLCQQQWHQRHLLILSLAYANLS